MVGKAYGFFNCHASKYEIERELPNIRHTAQVPSAMSLYLMEGMDELIIKSRNDLGLVVIAEEAKNLRRYVIEASYPDMSDLAAAKELTDVLVHLWFGSSFYDEGENLEAEIFYKQDGRYVLKDHE